MIGLRLRPAVLAIAFVVGAIAPVHALTVNIVDFIDSNGAGDTDGIGYGEKAVTSGPLIINGVAVTAFGGLNIPGTDYSTPYAYLDGGNAGMGVCSSGITADLQCKVASDDNVTGSSGGNEVLSVAFSDLWTVDQLLFRYEGHTPEFYGDGSNTTITASSELLIDIAIGNGAFTSYVIENVASSGVLGASLNGWTSLVNLTANTFIHMRFNNEQFYLSGIVLSEASGNIPGIPLPAGVWLLLSAIGGLAASSGWRKVRPIRR